MLLLCKELQPSLLPYASVLEEALKDKRGTSPALLSLLLGKEDAETEIVSGRVELSTARSKTAQHQIVLLPEHRPLVVPLVVRLLLAKSHARMSVSWKRSSLAVASATTRRLTVTLADAWLLAPQGPVGEHCLSESKTNLWMALQSGFDGGSSAAFNYGAAVGLR